MEEKDIGEFLNPAEEVAEAPATADIPRDEHGRFAAKETGVDLPAEPETGTQQEVPPTTQLPPETFKGLKEEREKRQALETELAALRAEFQALQQPKEPPAPPPSMWEDEQGWQQHFQAQTVNQSTLHSRVMMSEMLAAREHEDFAEMKAAYLQMERENPALIPQVMNSPDPWGTAYKIAKNAQTLKELGAVDMASLEAKLREQIMAEMQGQAPARPGAPPSLATARNVGSRSGPAWAGPKSLEDLLKL